jgi:hypothetical protein
LQERIERNEILLKENTNAKKQLKKLDILFFLFCFVQIFLSLTHIATAEISELEKSIDSEKEKAGVIASELKLKVSVLETQNRSLVSEVSLLKEQLRKLEKISQLPKPPVAILPSEPFSSAATATSSSKAAPKSAKGAHFFFLLFTFQLTPLQKCWRS